MMEHIKQTGRIRLIAFLARKKHFRQIQTILEKGEPGLWGNLGIAQFEVLFHDVEKSLENEPLLFEFFCRAVITELLLFPSCFNRDAAQWISKTVNVGVPWEDSEISLSPKEMRHLSWKRITLPLVSSAHGFKKGSASLINLVGSAVPHRGEALLPPWAMPLLSSESLQAIFHGERAARTIFSATAGTQGHSGRSPFLYPLVKREDKNKTPSITGKSLGLPTALLCLDLLDHGQSRCHRITASGIVTPKGMILPAGHIRDKMECARHRGLTLFLSAPCPNQNLKIENPPFSPTDHLGIQWIRANTLKEAWLHMVMHSRFSGPADSKIQIIQLMMQSGSAFTANMARADVTLLEAAFNIGFMDQAIEEIIGDGMLFEQFTRALKGDLFYSRPVEEREFFASIFSRTKGIFPALKSSLLDSRCDLDLDRCDLGLDSSCSLPTSRPWTNCAISSKAGLGYVTFALNCANNRGEVQRAWHLLQSGNKLMEQHGDIPMKERVDFINNRHVAMHNKYLFTPDPQALAMAEILNNQYTMARDMGSMLDLLFGRLCGTLSQNAGFCGPGHIDQFLKWHCRARECFCEKNSISHNYAQEWLRQYSYAVYAFLDADKIKAARKSLLTYLGIDHIREISSSHSKFSRWQHAVVARFMADTHGYEKGMCYIEGVHGDLKKKAQKLTTHPWQLWFYNAGRIAAGSGETDMAKRFFNKSVAIALGSGMGPTVNIMALLPLHGMWKIQVDTNFEHYDQGNYLSKSTLEELEERIRKAAQKLDPGHFSLLRQSGSLCHLFQNRDFSTARIFPFSFR